MMNSNPSLEMRVTNSDTSEAMVLQENRMKNSSEIDVKRMRLKYNPGVKVVKMMAFLS